MSFDARCRKSIALMLKSFPRVILNLGMGNSDLALGFAGKGAKLYGMDISPAYVAEARRRGVEAQLADCGRPFPFPDGMFDAVFAGEILEHLENTDLSLAEIKRVLKPGGTLVLTTPNLASLENRLRLLFGFQPLFADYTSRMDNHLRVYVARALLSQVREAGFAVEKHAGSFIPICWAKLQKMNVILMPLLSLLADLFPSLAMHTICVARKPAR